MSYSTPRVGTTSRIRLVYPLCAPGDVAFCLVEIGDPLGERLDLGQRHGALGLAKQALQVGLAKHGGARDAKTVDEERRRVGFRLARRRLDTDLRRRGLARRRGC